jgi:cell filamentation protein, protein adenylyltransferase
MEDKASFTTSDEASQPANRAGVWIKQASGVGSYRAFLPKPLPPEPPLLIGPDLQRRLESAGLALGRLDGIGRLLPGPDELLYSYVRKEAVLSSQIEGTQSSLAELLLYENSAAPGVPISDVEEVSNYIRAMNHGIELLKTLPLSLRLIREVHRELVSGSRGTHQTPGEFRRSQNWIGGTMPGNAVYVPPPPHEVMPALDALEKYLHAKDVPVLIKAGLIHVQFESIHPFLDGNGRVGRMLIPLLFVAEGALERPWLYVSLHFKRHRTQYYALLQKVRTHGAWEEWMEFYLIGIAQVADEAVHKIRELLALFERDRKKIEASRGRTTYQRVALHTNLDIYEHLRRKVAVRIPETADACRTTKPTVARAIHELEQLEIVREATGKARDRVYVYQEYLDILNKDSMIQSS